MDRAPDAAREGARRAGRRSRHRAGPGRRLGRAGADPELLAAPASPFATVGKDREVGNHLRYPARTHGRLFGTMPGGGDFTCSGTVVSSASRSLIYTAGHCLYDKESDQFVSNMVFTPAYKQGGSPYGSYAATDLVVLEGWTDLDLPEAYSYDVAVLTVDQPIEQLLGARGLKVNANPRKKGFDIFGYPARPDPPYDAERPIHCPRAEFVGWEDDLYPVPNPSIVAGPCNMMQGSSGGGWVLKSGRINSVVSHGFCDNEPQLCGITHGPYFAENAAALYQRVGGGTRRPSESVPCRAVSDELRDAKRAKRKAAKQKKAAKQLLKRAKQQGKKGKKRKAKKQIKSASKRKRKAAKQVRAAKQLDDEFRC